MKSYLSLLAAIVVIAVLSYGTIANANVNGNQWRLLLTSDPRAEPYRSTTLKVSLDDCDASASISKIKYSWTFGGAREDLGEQTSQLTDSNSVEHEFRGTGRRPVTVSACINYADDEPGLNTWCKGDMITANFEILVQYVRRELRDLPPGEWDLWVDAYWKIKTMDANTLLNKYGFHARTYDWLTSWHAKAALNSTCDQAHFFEGFNPFHRVFTRLLELSVQSIYPQLALPFWDQTYDTEHYNAPLVDSPIFGDNYFGGSGDPNDFYRVKNGRFALKDGVRWNIAKSEDYLDRALWPMQNPYGYLRSPWNINPVSSFARIHDFLFGYTEPRGNVRWQSLEEKRGCHNKTSFSEFHHCRDNPFLGAHVWPHAMLGGAKSPIYGDVTKIYTDTNAHQFGLAAIRVNCASPMVLAGIAQCPASCPLSAVTLTDISKCRCTCAPGPFAPPQLGLASALSQVFGLPLPPNLNGSDPRNICTIGGIMGELTDTVTSPNDPFFHFLHSDVDRAWANWQIDHMDLGIYGNYPEVTNCPGQGLHEINMGQSGMSPFLLGLGTETTPMTIAQIIERTLPPEFGHTQISPC